MPITAHRCKMNCNFACLYSIYDQNRHHHSYVQSKRQTLQCLETLYQSSRNRYQMVVWDNGSKDETAVAIRQSFPDTLVHQHPTNLGVASGRNAAAKLAIETFQPTHLLFLDNDILVEPNFVEALYQPFTENFKVGQTQAKLRFMHDRERLNDAGGARISFCAGR
jgi:GT2 family glycosyltransferase